MKIKAIIEIPKGDSRRRHIKPDKSGFADLGLIKDAIPINDGIMPINYGYIPDTLNEKEGDEIDVLVLSEKTLKIGQEIEVEPIALILREDGDDKIVAVDETIKTIKEWNHVSENKRKLIEEFFGHRHKIKAIKNYEAAEKYIKDGYKKFLI